MRVSFVEDKLEALHGLTGIIACIDWDDCAESETSQLLQGLTLNVMSDADSACRHMDVWHL